MKKHKSSKNHDMSEIQAKIKHNLTSAESSDEEEEVNLSPLKRRRNRKIPLDLDEINLALDFKGFLDVQTFFSDNFKWFEGAEETIFKLYPNVNEAKSADEPILHEKDKLEYNLDLSTLELSQVIKHRRLDEDDSTSQPGEIFKKYIYF